MIETDMEARTPMLPRYSRWTGDTLRRPEPVRSREVAGTSGTGE
jgi:hypothetical protein